MIKPTTKQLQLLYPNADAEYIQDCLIRQLNLINLEQEQDNVVDVIIMSCEDTLINTMNNFIQSLKRDAYDSIDSKRKIDFQIQIDIILKQLLIDLISSEIDNVVQTTELSAILQTWILEKHFTSEQPYEETGGEQTDNKISVKRKKLTKKEVNSIMNGKKNDVGKTLDAILNDLKVDINKMYDRWVSNKAPLSQATNEVKVAMNKVSSRVKQVSKDLSQRASYKALRDVELQTPDNYQIVYYRVEVLDADICMMCLSIDGSTNDFPLDQIHKNCRGIDVVLLKDLNTGKYTDGSNSGYGHKMKTQSFETKFSKLSKRQKKQMLGKSNYELYSNGKLSAEDFLSYNRQITKTEADTKVVLKGLKSKIKTPEIATKLSNELERVFKTPIGNMSQKQLLEYEKVLGYQKQLYDLVPKKNFVKRTHKSYIDNIDAKYVQIQSRRNLIERSE